MKRSLIYYDPFQISLPENYKYPGVEKFSAFFRIFNEGIVIVDRTGVLKAPIRTTSLFPIPKMRKFAESYEDICNKRADDILARSRKLGVPIYVMWSGGIDSTLVLVSLLKNSSSADRANITVLMSEESIAEYPLFYKEHVRGKLRTDSSVRFNELLGGEELMVGGEHNDQLFGSDMVGHMVTSFGDSVINERYNRDRFFNFFTRRLDDKETVGFYLDLFEKVQAASPVEIRTNFEHLWWLNFSLKWQAVHMRMLARAKASKVQKINGEYLRTRYIQFYCTDEFQLWSMNNMDKKIRDTWKTYKFTAKDLIYEYTKDANYRDNKMKRGSLYNLLVQQDTFNFIDDSFTFLKELPTEEYYVAENAFI